MKKSSLLPSPSVAPSKWLTMIAACFGLTMLYIDLFIVNVALPAIGRDLHAPLTTVSWTISGYVLMIGVLPMGMGRLGDLWGQRRVYLAGLLIFVVASLACGLAQNIEALVIFRVLQGIGAAVMTPGTLAIIIRAFPFEQQGLAIGIYGGISSLGLIAGPVLGGLLVHGTSWRWIFFVNVPLGIVAIAMTILFVPETRDVDAPPPLDWAGLALLSIGLLCILFAFTRAGAAGWLSLSVLGSGVGGIIILCLFAFVERRVRWPLIPLAVFRNRAFMLGCLSFFLYSAALFGSQPYWSLFMQNTWGFTPLQGGLAFLPATVLIAILTPFSGIIAQRFRSQIRFLLVLGALITGLSFLYVVFTLTPASTYGGGLLPAFLARGFGIPLFSSCATLLIVGAVPKEQSGLASGTLGMARNIGTAFGVAVLSQVFLFKVDAAFPPLSSSLPPKSFTALRAAAEQFLLPSASPLRPAVEAIVMQGFIWTCLACAILAISALLVALFVRSLPQPLMKPAIELPGVSDPAENAVS